HQSALSIQLTCVCPPPLCSLPFFFSATCAILSVISFAAPASFGGCTTILKRRHLTSTFSPESPPRDLPRSLWLFLVMIVLAFAKAAGTSASRLLPSRPQMVFLPMRCFRHPLLVTYERRGRFPVFRGILA